MLVTYEYYNQRISPSSWPPHIRNDNEDAGLEGSCCLSAITKYQVIYSNVYNNFSTRTTPWGRFFFKISSSQMGTWTLERWDKGSAITPEPPCVYLDWPCWSVSLIHSASGARALDASGPLWTHRPAWPSLNMSEFASALLSTWGKNPPVCYLSIKAPWASETQFRWHLCDALPWHILPPVWFQPSFPHDCQRIVLKNVIQTKLLFLSSIT